MNVCNDRDKCDFYFPGIATMWEYRDRCEHKRAGKKASAGAGKADRAGALPGDKARRNICQ